MQRRRKGQDQRKVAAEPAALICLIRSKAQHATRVGLETGATSPWLCHALKKADLPVVLMDARHANAALSTRPIKSDRSDARGLAEMLRRGWYRAVAAKSFGSHERLALLAARRQLVEGRHRVLVDARGSQDGLTRRSGGEAGSAGTVGGGDRVQPVGRSGVSCRIRPPQRSWRPTPDHYHGVDHTDPEENHDPGSGQPPFRCLTWMPRLKNRASCRGRSNFRSPTRHAPQAPTT